jgi:hypothetical protein
MFDRDMLVLTSSFNYMWPQSVLILCFFYAAIGRPERIRSLIEFRIAGLFLAAAVMAPTLLQVFIALLQPGFGGFRAFGQEMMPMLAVLVPPFLLMMSVILGLDSVIPRGRGSMQPPARAIFEDAPLRREERKCEDLT